MNTQTALFVILVAVLFIWILILKIQVALDSKYIELLEPKFKRPWEWVGDRDIEEMMEIFDSLPEEDRQEMLKMAEKMVEEQKKKETPK